MNLYRIEPDDHGWGMANNYEIWAEREYHLPGVHCSVCNSTWTTTGVIYPTVRTERLPNLNQFWDRSPVPVEKFREVAALIERTTGSQYCIKPGTDIGPLNGRIKGNVGDFMWQNSWTPLLRRSLFEDVTTSTKKILKGCLAQLKPLKSKDALIELEAIPSLGLSKQMPELINHEPCSGCGRVGLKVPDDIVIDGSTVDSTNLIFRVKWIPTIIVVTEEFANFITYKELTNVVLKPIATE